MEYSVGAQYVILRAMSEAKAFSRGEMRMEHLFLGLLKLSQLSCGEIAPAFEDKAAVDGDIAAVAKLFEARGIRAGELRQRLRRILASEEQPPNAAEQVSLILGSAAYHAQQDGEAEVSARELLSAIFRHPSPILGTLLGAGTETAAAAEKPDALPEEAGLSYLPRLNESIRSLRYRLLERIYGQDHAVHAFAEGMFAAQVLALADERRRQPRAVSVFAGPPGVGKTYMAEQAAQAMKLPFKRFDMSAYADHQAHIALIGFAPSYKDAKPGLLTDFVRANPRALLLFDEIEKANLNTIQLFLQILDAGTLHDDFLDLDVSFRDTVIIFTTNAGRQLYGGERGGDGAGFSRRTILNALETDINPLTGAPYFPPALCSRLSAGLLLMFNRLYAHDLERISAEEIARFSRLFEKQYSIRVDTDSLLPVTMLLAEGGGTDARHLRGQTQLFCRMQLFKLCGLWGESGFEQALKELELIRFSVDTRALAPEVLELYENPCKPELLLFARPDFAERCRALLPQYIFYQTQDAAEALSIAARRDIQFVLLDLAKDAELAADEDPLATRLSLDDVPAGVSSALVNTPIQPGAIGGEYSLLKRLGESLPELPVYLLESGGFCIDNELMALLSRCGARGKLLKPDGDAGLFAEELSRIAAQTYLQKAAEKLRGECKVLTFETAPAISADNRTATITLGSLSLRRAALAEDSGNLVEDAERPRIRFSDVIGAGDAKDELSFFVDYLREPRRFLAQGLKPPRGVLLYGPPGTGKTLLARAMAGESEVAFISAVASSFTTKYQGSGPEAVRKLFERARRYAPSVVFIDEIDAIGRPRGDFGVGHGEEMALTALLTEMDGFSSDPKRPVFVLAATNFGVDGSAGAGGSLDTALVRRFDRRILVDLPTRADRGEYIRRELAKHAGCAVSEGAIDSLAARSAGLSLADIEAVLELSVRNAGKRRVPLSDGILEDAFELSRHGEKKDWGVEYLERVARHEAGHALLCRLSGRSPAYLTIVARGGHGGYMEHESAEDEPVRTRAELLSRIRTALGGRAAELVYYGQEQGVSTGAAADLKSASRIAAAMILDYGMEGEAGLWGLSREEVLKSPLSAEFSACVAGILGEQMAAAVELVGGARREIDLLVTALLDKNKLSGEEIDRLLENR